MVLATEVRNWTYAGMRETINATFSMVGKARPEHAQGNHAASGTRRGDMLTAALGYGSVQAAINFTAPLMLGPLNLSATASMISNAGGGELAGMALMKAAAQVSAVRATLNTVGDVVDAFQLNALEVGRASGQHLAPQRTGIDYARLLDHSPARVAWNTFAGMGTTVLSLAMPPSDGRALLMRGGGAALFAVTYMPISQTYQAQATVRALLHNNAVAQLAEQAQHVERAEHVVDVNEISLRPMASRSPFR